ncbi:MAG: aminotransferase class V-fold PLP-dependent enzyme [Myxococcales bacterium]|nr:aminotransferase class V-fold PLP-dependent enzyme [Myxococcales bacterium]
MTSTVYLNHAGTSWPKPPEVHAAVADALTADPARWPGLFDEARAEVARFFGARDPETVVITPGCTSALAVALADLPWEAGDRLIIGGLEHHALHRPALALARTRGVELLVAPYAPGAPLDLDFVERALKAGGVRLLAFAMASNVTGELAPARELAALARRYGARCLVDAAQAAGVVEVDVRELDVDLLAFAGHKGPLGPQGVGGLYIAPDLPMRALSANCGGAQACVLGDMFQPGYCDLGSVNYAGLAGLAAGLRWIRAQGLARLRARTLARTRQLLEGVAAIPGARVIGCDRAEARAPVVSFVLEGDAPEVIATRLRARHGVVVRAGLQCAPLAHATLGTAAGGTVRASVGASTEPEDVAALLDALAER